MAIALESAQPFDSRANVLDRIVLAEQATQQHQAKLRELQDLGAVTPVETWTEFDDERIIVFSKGRTRTGIDHIVTVVVDRDDWQWKPGANDRVCR